MRCKDYYHPVPLHCQCHLHRRALHPHHPFLLPTVTAHIARSPADTDWTLTTIGRICLAQIEIRHYQTVSSPSLRRIV
jgi:hypothetical protein